MKESNTNTKKEELSDEDLVAKIVAKNDTHFFSILYDRYSDKVYGKCLGFSKSPEEAQDMTHDIFVQLFVKLKSFKGKSKFSTWLYAFTYNFCLNYLQRKLNKSKETFTELNEEYHGAVNEPEVSDAEIFEMKVDKLSKALELINPDEKALLLMKYQDDFSIQDIILALDIGESAVKMRLKRAKSKLINFYHSLD